MLRDIKEKLLELEIHRDERNTKIGFLVVGGLIILLLANVLYLNFSSTRKSSESRIGSEEFSPTVPLRETFTPSNLPTPSIAPSPTFQPTVYTSPPVAEAAIKEYFIAFGTGTNQTTDWADVPGLQAVIDFGNYRNIYQIVFETSVSVPTGNESVSVRLYNKTDQHPVWNSEVTMKDNTTPYLVSSPIVYDKGTKTYQVQMKTQLGYPANLTQSRLHLTLH